MHVGIDYGSKLAGTTVLCWEAGGKLRFAQSKKKQDADCFVQEELSRLHPEAVYIDAPLSLPGVYTGAGTDYFYRASDRAVGAMSPMFLGGLTARAMRLRAAHSPQPWFEIYPAQLARLLLSTAKFYKKENLPGYCDLLAAHLPHGWQQPPANWHQLDATLAWLSGHRHRAGQAVVFGEKEEGQIVV